MEDLRGYDEREYFENIAREVESKPKTVREAEHQAFVGDTENDITAMWSRIAAKDIASFGTAVPNLSSARGGARRAYNG
jgi:hypothetical protein